MYSDRIKDAARPPTLDEIRAAGLYKPERVIATPQGAQRARGAASDVLNLCANNYLGLADHPAVLARPRTRRSTAGATAWRRCASSAARRSSTRSWRRSSATFLGTEDTILYGSCFDANGGLFETLLGAEDAVISDELNHASHHRRHPALQGAAAPLPQQRHGRPGAAAEGSRQGARSAHDRHRRRVLDGRLRRQARRDLRPGRQVRRAGHGRRLARRRLHRRAAAAARTSTTA